MYLPRGAEFNLFKYILYMNQVLLDQLRQKLLTELEEITSILKERADKDAAIFGNYIAKADDPGNETEDEVARFEALDQNNDVVQQMELRLKAVSDALKRLSGTAFGLCVDCGKEIIEARLLANPAATHCIHCLNTAE